MLKKIQEINVNLVTKRPGRVLIVMLLLMVLGGVLASGLKMELNWVALAPKGHEAVSSYDSILEDFPAINNMMVVIESEDEQTIKSVAEDLEKELDGNDFIAAMVTDTGFIESKIDDTLMTMVMIQPNFDIMEVANVLPGVNEIEAVVHDLDERYEEVDVSVTGMHVVMRDETASIQSDSMLTTIISILAILLLLYFAFRSKLAPIFIFVPLIFGVIFDVGLTKITIGRLNMLTAFSAAMLIGLGIDYSIHLYSSYTEHRSLGETKEDSLGHAIMISGPGIITGALTTAVAFFALSISSLGLLKELGIVMGIGIICTLFAVFWVLPVLIMFRKEKEKNVQKVLGNYKILGRIAGGIQKNRILVSVILLVGTVFMGFHARNVDFDMNMLNLEPEGLKSIEVMEHLVDAYDMSTDAFVLEAESLEEAYALEEAYGEVDGVAEVASVVDVIQAIKMMQGMEDLSWNQELDEQIMEQLPENYRTQFISEDSTKYLVSVYPNFDIWENMKTEQGRTFIEDITKIDAGITGTPIFMYVLHESASEEVLVIGLVILAILLVILLIHFRSIKFAVLGIIPLILTSIFTLGTMTLIDLDFNMINFLGILLIIGIGIDDGVHILHHYKRGEHNVSKLYASVGRAILLTTLTTVLAFGSLTFSSYRGMASLGAILAIGVSYAFLMTVLVLPIFLKKEK